MEINIENIKAAYEVADKAGRKLLRDLFPKVFPETERIKTLYDACCEIGFDHPFVKNAKQVELLKAYDVNLTAFAHLRIICAALNEGWVAKPGNASYCPAFEFFTEAEVKEMDNKVVDALYIIESKFDTDFTAADYSFAAMSETESSCLRLKTSELAKYCGKQFINIWMDYLLPIKEND